MTEPMNAKSFEQLENQLDTVYTSAAPDPDFAQRLELQLAARAKAMQLKAVQPKPSLLAWLQNSLRRPVFVVALAAVLVLVLSVSLVGPQKVLAQVQRLLGFAPGYGFVVPGETRILPAPVEVQQGAVTLRIESVTADPQQTQILLVAGGLPHEKFGSDEMETPQESKPYLLLPDGTRLDTTFMTSGLGDTLQASLGFPALPANVNQVTLVLPRLPSLPAGFAPENWSVALDLQTTQAAGTAAAGDIPLTQPYTPENTAAAIHGVTALVTQVAQSDQETGVQVQYTWDNPEWQTLQLAQVGLSDETGRSYARHETTFGPVDSQAGSGTRTVTYPFEPLDAQAQSAILTIDQLTFGFASQAHLRFDLGRDAKAGQTWELPQGPDTRLDVAGVPVQPLSITVEANPNQNADLEDRYLLSLLVQTFPQDGLTLENISLSNRADRLVSGSSEGLADNQTRMTIGLAELPKSPMNLYLLRGDLRVTGPWKLEWKVPAKP